MTQTGPRRSLFRSPTRRTLRGVLTALSLALAVAAPASAERPPELSPAPGTRDFSFPRPTPVDEIYRAIGDAFGIDVSFEPKLKPAQLTIELGDVDAITALGRVADAAGHFYKTLDERSILVIADTPQNRRTFEDLVIRSFDLAEADTRDVMTLLRSIVDLHHVATDDSRRTLTIRDSADKVAVAEDLVTIADRQPGETEVAVDLLEVDPEALKAWLAGRAEGGQSTYRLPPGGLTELERSTAAAALVRPRLGLIGNRPARYRLSGVPGQDGETPAAGGTGAPFRVFELQLSGRIHPDDGGPGEVTLQIEVSTRELHPARPDIQGDKDRSLLSGELTSSVRLADGETFLITGLGSGHGSREAAAGARTAELRAPGAGGQRVLVVALTPRVITSPEPIPDRLEAMWVGTESHIRYAGGPPNGMH